MLQMFRLFSMTAFYLILSSKAFAGYLELNTFYFTDNTKVDQTNTLGRIFLEFSFGFAADKRGDYLIGWNYGSYATTDSIAGTTGTYASTQMGPRFLFMLDRAKAWTLGFAYNLVSTATYNPGTEATTWKGTGLKLDVGHNWQVTETVKLGIRLNYSSSSFSEEITGGTALSQVSYNKTLIYPSFYTFYDF